MSPLLGLRLSGLHTRKTIDCGTMSVNDYKCRRDLIQPINIPTAGAKAFLMGCTQGVRAIPLGPSADRWVLTTANAAGTNGEAIVICQI
jgi:hypothetical protein